MNSAFSKISLLTTEVHVCCRDISILPADMVLREILRSYLHEDPVIVKAPQGKPYLKDYPDIQFNLSHSKGIALIAITRDTPVGIDVEYNLKPRNIMGIAERFFLPEEFESLKTSKNPQALFFKLWTRKEAYLKLKGVGIANGLDQKIPDDFIIHDFSPAADYTAALILPPVSRQLISKQVVFFGM